MQCAEGVIRSLGETIPERWSGNYVSSRSEAQMGNLNSFGERTVSWDPDRQTVETYICLALMTGFNALSAVENKRVAWPQLGKTPPYPEAGSCNDAHDRRRVKQAQADDNASD